MYTAYKNEMASTRQVLVTRLPAKIVRDTNGFSYDCGGSVLKLAYRTKEDYEEALRDESPEHTAPVRLVSFSRQELDEAIEYIKVHAYISRTPGEDTLVYTTGIGGYQYKGKVEKALNIKVVNIPEIDCFVRTMNYLLKTMTREELCFPFDESATITPIKEATETFIPFLEAAKAGKTKMELPVDQDLTSLTAEELFGGIVESMQATGDPSKTMLETESDLYPCAMVFCGSGFALMPVTKDGTYLPGDMTNMGGLAFLGMGNVFLGCKNYDELLAWAKAGNSDNVDLCTTDVSEEMKKESGAAPNEGGEKDEGDGFYSTNEADTTNQVIFNFGKCVNAKREDFKKEDLAAALLRLHIMELARFVDTAQKDCGLKHVFLVGSFVADEHIRHLVSTELTRRYIQRKIFGGPKTPVPMAFHFMRQGAHLGALGGLINHTERFVAPSP